MKKIKPDKVTWLLVVEIVYILLQTLLASMVLATMVHLAFVILKMGG